MRVQSVMPGLKKGNNLGKLKRTRYTQYHLIRTTTTVGKNLKTIPSIHGQASLVVSKSIVLSVRCSEFP